MAMESIQRYPTTVEAHLAKVALEAVGIPSVVVGIGVGMEGGMEGVQLLVPAEHAQRARAVLKSQP